MSKPAAEEMENKLSDAIGEYMDRASRTLLGVGHLPLNIETAKIRASVWERLMCEGERLQKASLGAIRGHMTGFAKRLYTSLSMALETALPRVRLFAQRLHHECVTEDARISEHGLKMGCGNPGYLGCADVRGIRMIWRPLADREAGAVAAMKALGLDILGLPGARIPAFVKLDGKTGVRIHARWEGGTSYASAAILWRESLGDNVMPRHDIGSSRRAWARVQCGHGVVLNICIYYLPPEGQEEAWQAEVNGMDDDLHYVRSETGSERLSNVLAMGDANFQPLELGGASPSGGRREQRWRELKDKWGLTLHNPPFHPGGEIQIRLPVRDTLITVSEATTHHGPGAARAIDLTWSTPDVHGGLTIHNAISCNRQSACTWPNCTEYTRGDHFLSVFEALGVHAQTGRPAAPKFPPTWHKEERWELALSHAGTVFTELADLLAETHQHASELHLGPRRVQAEQWIGDAAAWIHLSVASVARDAWVQAAGQPRKPAAVTDRIRPEKVSETDSVAQALMAAHGAGQLPALQLNKCFTLLKKQTPQPCRRMGGALGLLTEEGTHQKWREQLMEQSDWGNHYDAHCHADIEHRVRARVSQARGSRGQGMYDGPITQPETDGVINDWDTSPAMPADLVPRAAFTCAGPAWRRATWLLQKLVGPGALAMRPRLWRYAALFVLYKKGDPSLVGNFRMLFVKAQMGLLQEGLLFRRVIPQIRSFCRPPQSGFVRSVEDTLLLLHETAADAADNLRALWVLFADQVKAFPRTWRADILEEAATGPRIRDGALALLGSILDHDSVCIWLSGDSVVTVTQGIPEGGCIGPMAYPLIPDSLLRLLQQEKVGIGVGAKIPDCWKGHVWRGCGTPDESLVQAFQAGIRGECRLPPKTALEAWPNFEASAARALDLAADTRLAAILHADDIAFCASSRGALIVAGNIFNDWASVHKCRLHVGSAKTVVMVCGPEESRTAAESSQPVTLKQAGDEAPTALHMVRQHRYLGVMWPADLNFLAALHACLQTAESAFKPLLSLVTERALPLPMAMVVFEAKVDATLFCRWLWILPEAPAIINGAYERWARLLLGGDAWRNAAVATSEVGWRISGQARIVQVVALRRARLFALPEEDFYRRAFIRAAGGGRTTWASKSKALLEEWVLLDWPEWSRSSGSYEQYKSYVILHLEGQCLAMWKPVAERHRSKIPYLTFQAGPSDILESVRQSNAAWEPMVAMRGWCRARAGYIEVIRPGHRRGERVCIFCGCLVRYAMAHITGQCVPWSPQRCQVLASMVSPAPNTLYLIARAVLGCSPEEPHFQQAVLFMDGVDQAAAAY